MQLPLQCHAGSTLSLQDQLFNQIRQRIIEGYLKPGTRLPASRTLAADLKLSRNTIVSVYDRLIAEGYLESHPPVGTFVAVSFMQDNACHRQGSMRTSLSGRDDVPAGAPSRRAAMHFKGRRHKVISPGRGAMAYDFWIGRPDARLFPIQDWMRNMRRKLRDMQHGNAAYVDPAGLAVLREAIADHVGGARGIRTSAQQIIIVNGTQEALTLLAQLFIREGTPVVTENPCYEGAANVFASHGARLCPVSLDSKGLMVDRLPSRASLVYVTPAHQYPTGVMLSPERREELLRWCHVTGAYVVEDDYNGDFCYDTAPLPALKSLDSCGQVIYLGTFSKSLGAGLRAGYMVVPPHLAEPAIAAKSLLNNGSGWAVQALLAEFMISGEYANHLRRIRTLYRERRNCLVDLLTSCTMHDSSDDIGGAHGGMHLAWQLPDCWPAAAELEHHAHRAGVGVYGMQSINATLVGHQASRRYQRMLLLGYAAMNEAEITEGFQRMMAGNAVQPPHVSPARADA